jgi:hypothetical protein
LSLQRMCWNQRRVSCLFSPFCCWCSLELNPLQTTLPWIRSRIFSSLELLFKH